MEMKEGVRCPFHAYLEPSGARAETVLALAIRVVSGRQSQRLLHTQRGVPDIARFNQ
jgi:hypothetical protein